MKAMKRKASAYGDDQPPNKVKNEEVQMVVSNTNVEPTNIDQEYDDIFCIDSADGGNKIWCVIGGVDTEVVVDSGSRRNIVDRSSWLEMKEKGIVTIDRQKEVVK